MISRAWDFPGACAWNRDDTKCEDTVGQADRNYVVGPDIPAGPCRLAIHLNAAGIAGCLGQRTPGNHAAPLKQLV